MTAVTDPEGAFVGAVLHLSAPAARDALDLLTDEDVAHPHLQTILAAARALARRGVAPDPVTIWALLRSQGTVSGVDACRELAATVADVYAACPAPASVSYYAAAVLDEALRRRCTELANRVRQAADGSPLDVLLNVLDAECRAVRTLLDRRAPTAGDLASVRLRAVGA